jgi:hypothetical protein
MEKWRFGETRSHCGVSTGRSAVDASGAAVIDYAIVDKIDARE